MTSELPLWGSVKEFARAIGVCPEYVRKAITEGVPMHGTTVTLEASRLPGVKRHTYRINRYVFGDFLQAIEWSLIPPECFRVPIPAAPRLRRALTSR